MKARRAFSRLVRQVTRARGNVLRSDERGLRVASLNAAAETQDDVARAAGLSPSRVAQIEKGE
jgi:hypothetical protein